MTLSRHWERIFNDHLPMAKKVETSEEIVAIDVNAIRKNVFVEVGSNTFVSVIPNFLESDEIANSVTELKVVAFFPERRWAQLEVCFWSLIRLREQSLLIIMQVTDATGQNF